MTNIAQLGPAPTPVEVGKFLKVDRTTVYRLLYAGRLKRITGFGRIRICPKSIEQLLGKTGNHTAKTVSEALPRWRNRKAVAL